MRGLTIVLLLLVAPGAAEAGYLGVRWSGVTIDADSAAPRVGVRLDSVVPLAPADRAGLERGDVIVRVDGAPLEGTEESVVAALQDSVRERAAGSELRLTVRRLEIRVESAAEPLGDEERARFLRDPESYVRTRGAGFTEHWRVACEETESERVVVLAVDPKLAGAPLPVTGSLFADLQLEEHGVAREIRARIEEHDLGADTADLRRRLAALAKTGDASRSRAIVLVHREPFRLPALARSLGDGFRTRALGRRPDRVLLGALGGLARVIDDDGPARSAGQFPSRPGLTPEQHLVFIETRLAAAVAERDGAIAALSAEERRHVEDHWRLLSERFERDIYLYTDDDDGRLRANLATLAIGEKIDRDRLLAAGRALAPLLDPRYLGDLRQDLERAGLDLTGDTVIRRDTPHGAVIIAGDADTWHRETGVAVLVDLGGDDFYGNAAGATVEEERSSRTLRLAVGVSLLVDVGGDDAYESTHDGAQGTGVLGVGILADLSGNDSYVGTRWAQGCGYLGLGALVDVEGDDHYRGGAFCQGVGLYGCGLLVDLAGDDRYDADSLAQSVGLAGGVSVLVDRAGNDRYFAKGSRPTGYGDEGIYDAWSQGCAVGFRTNASGGVALLIDEAGSDRYEAGNFSQGGGYYFGLGALFDHGRNDDHYIGSRYNQGFSAHQAAGYFFEEGGDDDYETRQSVVSGLAWDECVTFFVDRSGDDRYEGGAFSLGASAHNSIAVFLDRDGQDTYLFEGLGRASANNYHGGTSLSVFIDDGSDRDRYRGTEVGNGRVEVRPEHSIFVDR